MCGFWGHIGIQRTNQSFYKDRAKKLLIKRGEDGFGEIEGNNFTLLHARLNLNGAIEKGRQPFRVGSKLVLYNGEIYNKAEIIEKENLKHALSDSEILTQLVSKYSLNQISNIINGMYGISIYDQDTNILELAVDQYGQKPLFYSMFNDSIIFGSQAVAVKSQKSELRKDQLVNYLNFGFVNPISSIFSGVERIQPGQTISIDCKKITILESSYKTIDNFNWNNGALLDNFFDEYVDSPFPIGVTLSGGIDSSVIANYYSNHYKGNKIAFTVQVGDKSFSEAPQAKKYADLLDIDHKIIEVPDESVLNHWESGLSVLDEPNSDSAIITTTALMHVANKYVKCLLSGDGGDEVFGGYNRHKLGYLFGIIENNKCLLKALNLSSTFPNFLKEAVKYIFPSSTGGEFDLRINSLIRGTSSKNISQLYVRSMAIDNFFIEDAEKNISKYKIPSLSFSKLDMLDFDRYMYLVGNNLTRMDKISLGFGIECRAPFLDDRIRKSTFKEIKFKSKPKLKKLHAEIYGKENILKKGFSYPVQRHLLGEKFNTCLSDGIKISEESLGKKLNLNNSNIDERRAYNLASLGLWCSSNL